MPNMMNTANCHITADGGDTGRLLQKIEKNFLIGLRETDPALLAMFAERDVQPYRDLLSWSGEFAGKYLVSAHYVYRLTHDADLYDEIMAFIDELLPLQDTDGYLGCYSRACRLTGAMSREPEKLGASWDAWGHYHLLCGLLLWHDESGRADCLSAALRIGELFLRTFYDGRRPITAMGFSEMNLGIYHGMALLYERTGDERYLRFCHAAEQDMATAEAGDYLQHALAGKEFWQCPRPRWESLHTIMGFAPLYRATGDERYRQALVHTVRSILRTDVHNTGAFSTDEQAVGSPYRAGNIETCCVVAFDALCIEALRLTGDVTLIDHLELSHRNAVLGCWSPSGRWCTYHTPMDGERYASWRDIAFQSRPGSPQLNCCAVNAPRGAAQAADWLLLTDADGTPIVGGYEPFSAVLPDGTQIAVSGDYPADGRVQVRVTPGADNAAGIERIRLRIPGWSAHTAVCVGAQTLRPQAGELLTIDLAPGRETAVTLRFDMTPRLLPGAEELAGRTCIYAGPVLYAWDAALNNDLPFDPLPVLSADAVRAAVPVRRADGRLVLRVPLADDKTAVLCDFYRAGYTGSAYKTWLTIE